MKELKESQSEMRGRMSEVMSRSDGKIRGCIEKIVGDLREGIDEIEEG